MWNKFPALLTKHAETRAIHGCNSVKWIPNAFRLPTALNDWRAPQFTFKKDVFFSNASINWRLKAPGKVAFRDEVQRIIKSFWVLELGHRIKYLGENGTLVKKHVNPDVYRRHVISRYEGTDTRIQKAKREDRKKNLNFDTCIHGFPGGSGKESACRCMRVRRRGFIPWSGRSPRGGNGNPLHYSCLENPMHRGSWWATVHGVAKSQTQLSD